MRSTKFEFENSEGETLAGRLELPAGEPRAYAIFAHCFTCSKNIHAASRISRALAEHGFAVLRFDFTGLGNSEGDFANTNFSSNVEDLVAAAEHLSKRYETPKLLFGHSLGGAAVLAAASRIEGIEAVATLGAPSEPQHVLQLIDAERDTIETEGSALVRLAGREFTIKKQFLDDLEGQSQRDRIGALKASLLILHSPVDEIVGIDHARRIYEAARHPKSFVSLHEADHLLGDPADAEYVATVVAAWASRYVTLHEPPAVEAVEGTVAVKSQGSGFAQRIRAGRHLLTADEPTSVGGADTGPTPYDLLLSGLGACTSMTLHMYANHKKWPLEKVSVRLKHSKVHARDCEECESSEGKIDRIDRELSIEGPLDAEQRSRLLEIADKCPVHRTLTRENQIVTKLVDWELTAGAILPPMAFLDRVSALPHLGIGVSTEYGAGDAPDSLDILRLRHDAPQYARFLEVGIETRKGIDGHAEIWSQQDWPTTYHFLDINLDDPQDFDDDWIDEVNRLVRRLDPAWMCGDAGLWHFGPRDRGHMLLLPPILSEGAARAQAEGIVRLREATGLEVLPENPPGAVYVGGLHLLDFFGQVCRHADTGMLLDCAHLAIYQKTLGHDPLTGLDEFPLDHVVEMHVAGSIERDLEGYRFFEDAHTPQVLDDTWTIFEHAAQRAPNLRAVVFECERNRIENCLPGFARIESLLEDTPFAKSQV